MEKFIFLLFSISILFIQLKGEDPSADSQNVQETFDYVTQAKNKLKLPQNEDLILVLGITGVGKSALVHYVAGDYSKLESIAPQGLETEYTVYDGLDFGTETISSTVSRTNVPECIIDEDKKVWCDCPGFHDTRNSTIEIATTFLIKSLIENTKNVKIVLVADYYSVTPQHDRGRFDELLTFATILLQDVELFVGSVSLVVTKAPALYVQGQNIIAIDEESIKNKTAEFIMEHRSVLQAKRNGNNKIKLIDTILEQSSDGDYQRLSIFWRPPDAGPFNKIDKMINGRQRIRQSILKHTKYIGIKGNSFGFPLTADTRIHIEKMQRQVIQSIFTNLVAIDDKVLSAFKRQLNSDITFQKKLESLSRGMKCFQSNNDNITTNEVIGFIRSILTCTIRQLNIKSIRDIEFDAIRKDEDNFNILKKVAASEVELPVRDLIAATIKTKNYWSQEHKWYILLNHIIHFLGSYDVQKQPSAYNVANLSDWKHLNRPQGLVIDVNNFAKFIDAFGDGMAETYDPTPTRLIELNQIIDVTLKSLPNYRCSENVVIIKANYLLSSDIDLLKCSPKHVSKIVIYIVSTFYIDSDMNFNGIEEVKIFGSKWIVLYHATINMNGLPWLEEWPYKPFMETAKAGRPGNSGTNAGNFFGLATEIQNGELLTWNLNGGQGGIGQDGTGSKDISFEFNEDSITSKRIAVLGSVDDALKIYYLNYFKCKGYDAELISGDTLESVYFVVGLWTKIVQVYRLHPKKCCGATGKGGPGGLGGLNGTFTLKLIGNTTTTFSPKINSNIGLPGKRGRDGRICKSSAVDVKVKSSVRIILPILAKLESVFETEKVQSPRCSDTEFITSNDELPGPLPSKPLNYRAELTEFKRILSEKIQPLAGIMQKTIDEINLEFGLN